MAKKVVFQVGRFYHHYPKTVAIVTAGSWEKVNALAVAWHCPLSYDPPLYGVSISPRRFSLNLILNGKEFGVNFLPLEKAELIAAVGGTTGKEVDKFAAFALEKMAPVKISVPLLEDAYAAYECRLIDHHTYGDHEWLVGEIVAVHFDPDLFTGKEVVDLSRVSPALYLGDDRYVAPARESLRYIDREKFKKEVSWKSSPSP